MMKVRKIEKTGTTLSNNEMCQFSRTDKRNSIGQSHSELFSKVENLVQLSFIPCPANPW